MFEDAKGVDSHAESQRVEDQQTRPLTENEKRCGSLKEHVSTEKFNARFEF